MEEKLICNEGNEYQQGLDKDTRGDGGTQMESLL